MKTRILLRISGLIIISIILISCPPDEDDEIILPGNIMGTVIDAETSEPIADASIKVMHGDLLYYNTITGIYGTYTIKKVSPREYTIQASKLSYVSSVKQIEVTSTNAEEINFTLKGIPVPVVSVTYLDYGLDLNSMSFTISNNGKGKFSYIIVGSKGWITISPFTGDVTNEIDIINVVINRTGLSDSVIYKEKIEITSIIDPDPVQDTIGIYLNGVFDKRNSKYYKIVKIGSQIWMGENLNLGTRIDKEIEQTDNEIIEKYCYNGDEKNCNEYGGLYQWNEMMDYNPPDSGEIGTTQGICPEGYHIPTDKEWNTLRSEVGGNGGKLKERGTEHWAVPNTGATNESGFTGLPAGLRCTWDDIGIVYDWFGTTGIWWTSNEITGFYNIWLLSYDNAELTGSMSWDFNGLSVRCIKNP